MTDTTVRDLFGIHIRDAIRFGMALSRERTKAAAGLRILLGGQDRRISRRTLAQSRGLVVPPLMILSLTRSCNLHCAGCYSHARREPSAEISDESLDKLLSQADDLGVSIVMLAGGEPMMRPKALELAANYPRMLFLLFTNGLLIDASWAEFFALHSHILPILSVEGGQQETDERRGAGTHDSVMEAMSRLDGAGAMFGVSVTATMENREATTGDAFVDDLCVRGARVFFYVEYVPQDADDTGLALDSSGKRALLASIRKQRLRRKALLVAFPGDEEPTGGCLAGGRGFFHVDVDGSATPCPFTPYADANVADGLEQALRSPFLARVREHHGELGEGTGGCTLWRNREKVEAWLQR